MESGFFCAVWLIINLKNRKWKRNWLSNMAWRTYELIISPFVLRGVTYCKCTGRERCKIHWSGVVLWPFLQFSQLPTDAGIFYVCAGVSVSHFIKKYNFSLVNIIMTPTWVSTWVSHWGESIRLECIHPLWTHCSPLVESIMYYFN